MVKIIILILLVISSVKKSKTKVYEKCEAAQHLASIDKHFFEEINTWLCIINGESSFNTSAIHYGNDDSSDDHGLFQINDRYWCDPNNGKKSANVCSISCHKLRDDDISDDVECVKRIYEVHGFTAWVVYEKCKNDEELPNWTSECVTKKSSPKKEINLNKWNLLPVKVKKSLLISRKKYFIRNIKTGEIFELFIVSIEPIHYLIVEDYPINYIVDNPVYDNVISIWFPQFNKR